MNYESRIEQDEADPEAAAFSGSNRRKWLFAGLVLIGLLAILGISSAILSSGKQDETMAPSVPVVTIVRADSREVTRIIAASGSLGARRDIDVGVTGEGGQVARVLVEAGQWVEKGQVLAAIDRSVQIQQIAALRSQIAVAQADLNLAQAELDRAAQLVGRGFISKADMDRKTATRDGARARLGAAQAGFREAQARTARLDIRAPVGGIVLERNIEAGQNVTPASGMLFRMADGGQMEMAARLSESELSGLSIGQPARVRPVGTDLVFDGSIWQISPVVDAQSRQAIVRIALPYNNQLRPGGFATAEIASGRSTAPVLPESAIQVDRRGAYVYVVGRDNRVSRRDVKTGVLTSEGMPVVEGLNGNEAVVLFAAAFLSPGDKIQPKLRKSAAR